MLAFMRKSQNRHGRLRGVAVPIVLLASFVFCGAPAFIAVELVECEAPAEEDAPVKEATDASPSRVRSRLFVQQSHEPFSAGERRGRATEPPRRVRKMLDSFALPLRC